MSDEQRPVDPMENPDLDLITDYLIGELDEAHVAEVRRRLEHDAAFRDFAAPILVAWSVPPRWQRKPMPRAELEKHWDDFTKRAGFEYQRRRTRRRRLWMLTAVVATLGASAIVFRDRIRERYEDHRFYDDVPRVAGWITLRDGSQVLLSPGAHLRSAKVPGDGGLHRVKLEGAARFRVTPPDTSHALLPEIQPFEVQTRAASVLSARGEFSVSARGDTTDVEVHVPEKRVFLGFLPLRTQVLIMNDRTANPLTLNEGERGRGIRGGTPIKLLREGQR